LSGSVANYHPTYNDGVYPYTSPVGTFAANGYGLHDMAGNVSEYCWDWHGTYAAGSQTNPLGAISGTNRVMRGGSWYEYTGSTLVACRIKNLLPVSLIYYGGFRVVRSSAP
jgi:formylglycine-generating enzyme required for sulfatase activity